MDDERYYWLALNSIEGIGNVLYRRLVDEIGAPDKVFSASRERLAGIGGLPEKLIDGIVRFKKIPAIVDEIRAIDAHPVSFVHILDPKYPGPLKTIHDPPPYLYVMGELWDQDERAVAVVGSRKPTLYGIQVANRISADLARCRLTVVSGFAAGIDQTAHQASLTAGGRTIAVLGCGIDVHYPPGSQKLKEAISQQGAVLSEFAMGTRAAPGNFPRRNRLISGLSAGVVVVEAAEKSGSLITASMALEQGREVFSIPGPIHSELSRGTHYLIKSGAKLVESVSDILEELPESFRSFERIRADELPELEPDERKIYDILSQEPLHLDEISVRSGMSCPRCLEILLRLELTGTVLQIEGNQFISAFQDKGING